MLNTTINDDVVNNIQIWQSTGKPEGTVGKAFVKGYSHFKSPQTEQRLSQSDKILMAYYLRFVLRTDMLKEQNKFEQIVELLIISYHVGHALSDDPIIKETLIRRIRKLGDYCGAARAITKAMNIPNIRELGTAIRFIEVSLISVTASGQAV